MILKPTTNKTNTAARVMLFTKGDWSSLPKISKDILNFIQSEAKQGKKTIRLQQLDKLQFFIPIPEEEDQAILLEKIRTLGNEVQAEFNKTKTTEIIIENHARNSNYSLAFAEGLALGNYQFLKYKKEKKDKANSLKTAWISDKNLSAKDIAEFQNIIEATSFARDMINEPLSYLTAEQFSKEISWAGKKNGFKVSVLKKKEIEKLGMGGLLAVNKGSIDPPTFNILEWKPEKAKNKKPIVLVGKGVVFDTGGLSLKPTPGSMDEMKCDMSGGAAVAGALCCLAANNIAVHVIGLIPATDNRPGMNAYVPQDVIKMFDGTTVEVLNTDAEGRMILADALSYAKKYQPELVIDLATLTGAAVRAVGSYASAIMGTAAPNDFDELEKSGFQVFERCVRFPMWKEYGEEMKSEVADLKNLGGPNAGHITAAKFLEHFTDYPWIHIDIAGPAWLNTPSAYRTKGGTGVGVRLLYNYIRHRYN